MNKINGLTIDDATWDMLNDLSLDELNDEYARLEKMTEEEFKEECPECDFNDYIERVVELAEEKEAEEAYEPYDEWDDHGFRDEADYYNWRFGV